MTKPDSAAEKSGPNDELVERIAKRMVLIAYECDPQQISEPMMERMRRVAREIAPLVEAAQFAYDMAEWQCDDDADEADLSPEDAVAHINGLIRQNLRAALKPWVEPTK